MDVSPNVLRRDTVQLIRDINSEMDETVTTGNKDRWATLLLAKATAYNTLVMLNQKKGD